MSQPTLREPSTQRQPIQMRTLGPVADLEAHLPEDWWRKLFNAMYLKTDGDVVENNEGTQKEVDAVITAAGLGANDQILDLCCGQGRHVLEFARRGFRRVTGLDRSRYLVRLGKRRAAAEKLTATFKEGDARNPRLPEDHFDAVVILGNSFGYFANKKDDAKVLKSVARLLRPTGKLVLDLADGSWLRENFEPRSWEWIDAHHFVCRERSLASDGERLISREVVTHDETGILADQFYAERLYTKESIADLLNSLGYRNVRHQGTVNGHSDRAQDLGMMARRMLITADAPVTIERKRKSSGRVRNVTVLLGDPRKPDIVKRGGQFNEEDIATVNTLKEALATLPGYSFRYLDNHTTLVNELATLRTDLVMNLCDEGFGNDAFKELHVPALLEVFDLQYTGAAPGCLANCYDKSLVRAIAMQLDIPVPLESYIRPEDQGATLPSVFPAILKPNFGDSSEGVTRDAVVRDQSALLAYLESLHAQFPNRPVLVQEYLEGSEYSVALVGNPKQGLRPFPILEVDFSQLDEKLPRILGYESKWLPDSPYWTQIRYRETDLAENKQAGLIDYSARLFERLGCRDYARFDFRADKNGNIKLLEVNPNPGWCWDGKHNLMAGFMGWSYAEMLASILNAAEERLGLNTAFQQARIVV